MDEKQAPTPASQARFDEVPPQGFLRTALQFVAIPLFIVAVGIGLVVGYNVVFDASPKSAADFVEYLRSDTINRRWQAAYELAARLSSGEVPAEFHDPALVRELCKALDEARKEGENPPRRAILVLAILRRLQEPSSLPSVRAAMEDPHTWVRSHAALTLGVLKDEPSRPTLVAFAESEDPGSRQAALEALCSLDQVEGVPFHLSAETRSIALEQVGDPAEDVRFTAALVLADAGEREAALPVLRKMLDRSYLEKFPFDDRWGGLDDYRIRSRILLKAIARAVFLRCGDDAEVMNAIRRLTNDKIEGDDEVRDAARKALSALQLKTE